MAIAERQRGRITLLLCSELNSLNINSASPRGTIRSSCDKARNPIINNVLFSQIKEDHLSVGWYFFIAELERISYLGPAQTNVMFLLPVSANILQLKSKP